MIKIKKIGLILFLMATTYGCHVGRFFYYNFADINDYKKFPQVSIEPAQEPFILPNSTSQIKLPQNNSFKKGQASFDELLANSKTAAFLILKNDSIVFEKYFDGYESSSILPSFSVAKSFVSALVGIAIEEGHIHSVHDPITRYWSFKDSVDISKITIKDVLDMSSGLAFNESYFNPFGHVAKYYYGLNTTKYLHKIKVEEEPGKFHYISANTQILSEIIENATGKSFLEYFNEKLWQPLQPEFSATWNMDSKRNKNFKTFCCLNARTRDFARLGLLYLHEGNWQGKQIVPQKWVHESTTFEQQKNFYLYSYQWWHNIEAERGGDEPLTQREVFGVIRGKNTDTSIVFKPYPDFFARGILGQHIYVHPQSNMVIVRLGKGNGGVYWAELLKEIAELNLDE